MIVNVRVTPPIKTGARAAYASFDALRFVAALVVVIEHARDLLMVNYAGPGRVGLGWKAFYELTIFGHQVVIVLVPALMADALLDWGGSRIVGGPVYAGT